MRNYQTAPSRYRISACKPRADNFTKGTVIFESPEEYAEWKKVYWSDENITYMQHVTAMEQDMEYAMLTKKTALGTLLLQKR